MPDVSIYDIREYSKYTIEQLIELIKQLEQRIKDLENE